MGERRALVIGSQCRGLPNLPLTFLPQAAQDLFEVLVDPDRGACDPDASRLLIDPDLASLQAEMLSAVARADAAQATLVIAFIGHAEAVKDDLYLLPIDGQSPPTMSTGYLVGQGVAELVRRHDGLDGLIMLVDACHSGMGVTDLAIRAAGDIAAAGMRVQLVSSTFDRAARDGCFSRTLYRLIEDGLPDLSDDYLLAEKLLHHVEAQCTAQDAPRAITIQGRWPVNDPGLFLARNIGAGDWLLSGTAAGGLAVDLTQHYHLTKTLDEVMGAWREHQVVTLSGAPGTGKSTLVAALARPELVPDILSHGFVHAVVFAATTGSATAVAEALARQLRRLVGFTDATRDYQRMFDAEQLGRQDALTRLVLGPLRTMRISEDRRVRIAVDGMDQLDDSSQKALTAAAHSILGDTLLSGVRLLLTGRPESIPVFTPPQVALEIDGSSSEAICAYLLDRGVPEPLVTDIMQRAPKWLDARQFAELVLSINAPEASLPNGVPHTLLDLYSAVRSAIQERTQRPKRLQTTLAVLAAAGSGPVLPIALLRETIEELGYKITGSQLRGIVVQLDGLVVRAKPGTHEEQIGLVHETLSDYLRAAPDMVHTIRQSHDAILSVLERDDHAVAPRYWAYGATARGHHLWAVSRYAVALDVVEGSLNQRPADDLALIQPWLERCAETLGMSHILTLRVRNLVAVLTGEAGDVSGAREQLARLLRDSERILGPAHPYILTFRNNHATWTGQAGDPGQARILLEELLPLAQKVLGPDDPETFPIRSNLAIWTGKSGDPEGARILLEKLLPVVERAEGQHSFGTFATRNNLAQWTGQAGDPSRAAELFAALVPDVERVLGPDHPRTLTARHNLARWSGEAGNARLAAALFAALLPDVERVLGAEHPQTQTTRWGLAKWQQLADDTAKE